MQSALTAYEPFFLPGLTFVTCATVQGEPVFGAEVAVQVLRRGLEAVRPRHPFRLAGHVVLPDHLHLLLAAEGDARRVANALMARFTADYQTVMGSPHPMVVWESTIRVVKTPDVAAFAARLDQIHLDPVHHGCTDRPEHWPHSSYQSYVERKLYKLGWGWVTPQSWGM